MYGDHIAGGDLHFFEMARAAAEAGYTVNFFGGHALADHAKNQQLPVTVTLTDPKQIGKIDVGKMRGQIALFLDYTFRFLRTLPRMKTIRADDLVYATTDYWFDVLPAVFSKARHKMMVLHMQAPSLAQIIRRSRADVDATRFASFHYWLSQNVSLAAFRRCARKRLLHVHPAMRPRLLARGYREHELKPTPFGVDPNPPGATERVEKIYDVVWIGRVHRQKGIDDLLATLGHLAKSVEGFRAVIVGKVQSELAPKIQELGLSALVDFPGFVSEAEKFRLFRASRVFLMPSRFEGSPRVIGEALICGLPVVAYNVETYRAVFGDFLRYVPCYDVQAFQAEAENQVRMMRAGTNYLEDLDLEQFKQRCSWETARQTFAQAMTELMAC